MKTKQDNDVIDGTGATYTKNQTKLSWPIKPAGVYDEIQTKQRCDQSYRSDLRWNRN